MANDEATLLLATALTGAWSGAALYQVAITGPTLREAGGAAIGFARVHAKRWGTGLFFAGLAFLSVAAGALAWWHNGGPTVLARPVPLAPLFVSLGLGAGVLGLARGATANRVAEARYLKTVKAIRGTPSAAEADALGRTSRAAARANAITAATVALAAAFYVLSALFAA